MKVSLPQETAPMVYGSESVAPKQFKKKCCKKFRKAESKRCKKCPGRAACGVIQTYNALSAHLAD